MSPWAYTATKSGTATEPTATQHHPKRVPYLHPCPKRTNLFVEMHSPLPTGYSLTQGMELNDCGNHACTTCSTGRPSVLDAARRLATIRGLAVGFRRRFPGSSGVRWVAAAVALHDARGRPLADLEGAVGPATDVAGLDSVGGCVSGTANAIARRTEARVWRCMVAVCGRGIMRRIVNVRSEGAIEVESRECSQVRRRIRCDDVFVRAGELYLTL